MACERNKYSSFNFVRNIVKQILIDERGILDLEGIYECWANYLCHEEKSCCQTWFPEFCKSLFTLKDEEGFLLNKYISGIILPAEHILQNVEKTSGINIVKKIKKWRNVHFGCTMDRGCIETKWHHEPELVTEGNDDLQERCKYLYRKGYTFARWRYFSNSHILNPSHYIKNLNACLLCRFIMMCVSNEIAPIFEIVFTDDRIIDPERCDKEILDILNTIFKSVFQYNFTLKTLMFCYSIGNDRDLKQNDPEAVSQHALTNLQQSIPGKLGGIFIAQKMSSEELYTKSLDQIKKTITRKPWPISFIIGKNINIENDTHSKDHFRDPKIAADEFLRRLKETQLAIKGSFEAFESEDSSDDLDIIKTHDFALLT